MIAEAIDKVQTLALLGEGGSHSKIALALPGAPTGVEFVYRLKPTENGRELGEILQPPRPAKLQVSTLTGFLDAIAAGVCGDPLQFAATGKIIHVEDYLTVSVKSAATDLYGVRDTLLTAKYTPPGNFVFDQFQNPETFIIGLETMFLRLDGDDTEYVKKLASNLKAGDTVHSQDDGVNQTVTLKMGQVESAEHAVKARVKLTPIRTFSESAPCQNEFLIRFKPAGSGLPTVALYNLSGTLWQNHAMLSIKKYLGDNLPSTTPILA